MATKSRQRDHDDHGGFADEAACACAKLKPKQRSIGGSGDGAVAWANICNAL